MNLKSAAVLKYWESNTSRTIDYTQIDPAVLKLFNGIHPKAVQSWLPKADGLFKADPNHSLTSREKKHRRMLKLEEMFGVRFNKKHYRLIE